MNNLPKNMFLLAALMAIYGIGTIFLPHVEPTFFNKSTSRFMQNGYSSGKYNSGSYGGGTTSFTTVDYGYRVDGQQYYGSSITFSEGGTLSKVYYLPLMPSYSIIERGFQLVLAVLLALLGLGFKAIRGWVTNPLNR